MARGVLDFTKCYYCCAEDVSLQEYYGLVLCRSCIDMEENTDWDEYEQQKRERIAESNEY